MSMVKKTGVQFAISFDDLRREHRARIGGQSYDEVEQALKAAMRVVKHFSVSKVEVTREGMMFTATIPEDANAHQYAERVKKAALEVEP